MGIDLSDSNIYLDLEETIIQSWHDPLLINVEKLRSWLHDHNAKKIHIFSFAIYNDRDSKLFEDSYKPMIERALQVEILTFPSIITMAKCDTEQTGQYWLRESESIGIIDYVNTRGKQDGFVKWAEFHHEGETSVLIDDVVKNMMVSFWDSDTHIETINVNSIENGLFTRMGNV
jgi:hypothetical protein